MGHQIHHTIIRFPEIQLFTRDAHKLRGCFGSLFQEYSPLLHNHLENGDTMYRYPLVQYKVLQGVPTLVGLNEGADLLMQLFLKIKEFNINGEAYTVLYKNIESRQYSIGLSEDLHAYRFATMWMALNQKNYSLFVQEGEQQQLQHLKAVLIGNILSFYKTMDYHVAGTIMASLKVTAQKETRFKNNTMMAFNAEFVTNNILPEYVGLGKSVARGFGTISSI